MKSIDAAVLVACGVGPVEAERFAPFLPAVFERFDIWLAAAQAAFVAQAMHESAKFMRLEENLSYKTPERIQAVFGSKRFPKLSDAAPYLRNPQALANFVYANRLGNGDVSSGDGARYAGRGVFQLTGRANYRVAGDALGQDFVSAPALVKEPEHAAMTAGWFWANAGCNPLMAGGDFDGTTLRLNGKAMAGAAERRALFEVCRGVIT